MKYADIFRWDARARAGFTYQEDPLAFDNWRTHALDVLNGKPWADDCDGLAMTVLDLCIRDGLPMEDAFRLAVRAASDGSGHMVGCVYDDDLNIWIVGDTFEAPYMADFMRHKPNIYNRMSEQEWRAGVPWRLTP